MKGGKEKSLAVEKRREGKRGEEKRSRPCAVSDSYECARTSAVHPLCHISYS